VNYFRYKIMEPTGRIASGVIELPYDNTLSAITHLERSDNTVIYVKKMNAVIASMISVVTKGLRRKVSRDFLAETLSNISVMLKAGLALIVALRETTEESGNPYFDNTINTMATDIEMGSTFSEAAAKHPHLFPKTVIHLFRIGEESGNLDNMLMDASQHLRRLQQIISDTKQALLYPAFVFVTMGSMMIFWFYYVVPKILSLFTEMQVELPLLTVYVLNFSEFVQEYILLILMIPALAAALLVAGIKRSRKVKKIFDEFLLRLPVFHTIITASNLAFITEYLSLLLNAGLDIRRSLSMLTESIDNEVFRKKMGVVQDGLYLGSGVADSFRSVHIFPPFVTRMISVGEQSGSLTEQLKYISEDYRKKISAIVASMGKMIEPVVLIFAGLIFAIILGAIFLPIYDLVGQVGSR